MRVRTVAAMLLAMAGLSGTGTARIVTPERAPRAWLAYAETATGIVTGWVNGGDPQSAQLRAAIGAATDGAAGSWIARLWLDRNGTLIRAALAAPSGPPQADAALRGLLVGRKLPPPPRVQREPQRLALDIRPGPPPPAAPATLTSNVMPSGVSFAAVYPESSR